MDARRRIVACLVALLVVACGGGAPSASPARSADAFAGRFFRLSLPAGWIVLGSAAYDPKIDATPDVAGWLAQLDLVSQHAFRAYEPKPEAGGVRLAINPVSPWRLYGEAVFHAQANIEDLPGVQAGSVESVWIATEEGKGFGYQWIQELDWGDGTISARTCIGWEVSTQFDPLNVVLSWPAGPQPSVDVDALMAGFQVTGNPAWSLPPGVTMPPSPTPFDKEHMTPEPVATFHVVPDLEALLPSSIDGRPIQKQSRTGVESGMNSGSAILRAFGKQPSDYEYAEGYPQGPPLLIVGVTRLRGVSAGQLLTAQLGQMSGVTATVTTLAGRQVTATVGGMFPVWYWANGELLYGVVATSQDDAARVFALLS